MILEQIFVLASFATGSYILFRYLGLGISRVAQFLRKDKNWCKEQPLLGIENSQVGRRYVISDL